ncbi:putative inorganic phosphate cotransporter isoform X2 [Homalodisca vitripennis]|uniref:putative inorganic phosphate cotransporter isoform X2 n=1 Tax=Homalodisca vitripennis TaxID=197043 RepID=UPI001EEC8F15|nr:putative inorganic phosphate cotransporter isoform X2 [Homalodisca vitripennis]
MSRPPGLGTRHCQALMTFSSIVLDFSIRSNLSIGIVAMTDNTRPNPSLPVLPWTSSQKGIILGSLFWGYFLTTAPGGHLSRKWGPKYLMFAAMLVCAVISILCPFIALNYGWFAFSLSRVVLGLAQGFLLPSVHTHLAKWTPLQERNRTIAIVISVVTMPIAGYLAASSWGWPSIFYCTGLCGVLWSAVWLFVGADSPESHPSISDREREYIITTRIGSSSHSQTMKTPWWPILTSKPVWALTIAHFSHNWGKWTLLTELSSYLRHVYGYNIKSNGLISALPHLCSLIMMVVFSWAADFINSRDLVSLTSSRKISSTIAQWGGAIALCGLPFISSPTSAVTLLTVSIALGAASYTGSLPNPLDLSPNFTGLVLGITFGLGSLSAILGPSLTGFIVTDETNRDQWMNAFYVAAAVYFVGNAVFIWFGSAEVQWWNDAEKVEDETEQ